MATATTTAVPKHPVEQWLDQTGIEYERKMVPLDSIDVDKSRHNQARFQPINEEQVARYADALRAGAVFPPLIGYAKGRKVVIIDGNHRDAAAREVGAVNLHPFYLVKVDEEGIDKLTWSANTVLNGERLTVDERKAHAVRMIEQGQDKGAVALLTGLSTSVVTNAVQADRATRRAAQLKVLPDFTKLSEGQRISAGRIQLNAAFVEAVHWAANTEVTAQSTEHAFRAVARAHSEAEASSVLKHEISVREDAQLEKKNRRHKPTAFHQALMHTTALAKFNDPDSVLVSMPTEKRASFASQIEQAEGVLHELRAHLDKLA